MKLEFEVKAAVGATVDVNDCFKWEAGVVEMILAAAYSQSKQVTYRVRMHDGRRVSVEGDWIRVPALSEQKS